MRGVGLLLMVAVLAGCAGSKPGSNGAASGGSDVSFSSDILPLLREKWGPLLRQESGLRLDSWETLIAGSDFGEVLIPFDSDNSLLIELATKMEPPSGAARPTPAEVDQVRRWIDGGARNDAGAVPYADAANLLYVCDQGEALVSVVDMDAKLVVRTVNLQDLGFSATAKPHHTAVEPDGSFWYLSLIGENKVLKFNRANELVGQAEFEVPGMLALHPTQDLLYVGRSMSAVNPPQRIGVVRRSDMTIDEIDVFYPRPHALLVDPRGNYVYSASLAENRIGVIDVETEQLTLKTVEGEHVHTLVQFAASPDGTRLIAGGEHSGKLLVFDASRPLDLTLLGETDVKAKPWHPSFAPDGHTVYFGNKGANAVTFFDVDAQRVAAVVEGRGLSQPHGSALSQDGRYLFVANNNLDGAYSPRYDFGDNALVGTVVVINTATKSIEKVIEVEDYATGVGAARW